MTTKRRHFNRKLIEMNISEAIEELERIRDLAVTGELKEEAFQVRLGHAYHHLNLAWNARRVPLSVYGRLTDRQLEEWGKYPKSIEKF
jgi:hypothetical protein